MKPKQSNSIQMHAISHLDGRMVAVGRAKDGSWVVLFRRKDGKIVTDSKLSLTNGAMNALVALYLELRDEGPLPKCPPHKKS